MPNHSAEYRAYKLLQKFIVGCTLLVITAVLLMFMWGANKSQIRCDDLQSLRYYVLHSTDRAIKSLPTIAYYQEHPEEKAQALATLQDQRDEFVTPLDCSLF